MTPTAIPRGSPPEICLMWRLVSMTSGTAEHYHLDGKITVTNLMDKVALYNFLSSFSGTHFVTPRSVQAELRLRF